MIRRLWNWLWTLADSDRNEWDVVRVLGPGTYETLATCLPYALAMDIMEDWVFEFPSSGEYRVMRTEEVLAAGGIAQRRAAFKQWRKP